jgi:hypothetical protein
MQVIKKTKKYVVVRTAKGQEYKVNNWVSFWDVNCSDSELKVLLEAVKGVVADDLYQELKAKVSPTAKQKKAQIARARAAKKYFTEPNPYLDKLEQQMISDPGFCPWVPDRQYGKSLVTPEVYDCLVEK